MAKKKDMKNMNCNMGGGSACNPVYGLGLLGAVVYFWQTSPDLGTKLFGIIKALFWPALLIYGVLEKLAM